PAGFPAAHGVDGEPLRPGRVYVAPPDQHLLVERERIQITRGRKENRFRPAVDALFRSAAYALLQGACRGISWPGGVYSPPPAEPIWLVDSNCIVADSISVGELVLWRLQ